jgi:hypothetical protein
LLPENVKPVDWFTKTPRDLIGYQTPPAVNVETRRLSGKISL